MSKRGSNTVKNPDWIIKNANELKRYSNEDKFKTFHYTPSNKTQDNLLTTIFSKYHIENAGIANHKKGYYHSRINDSFTDLIIVRKGAFSAKFDKKSIKVTANNIIVIPPYKLCDNFAEKNGIEVYWLHPKISSFWKDIVPTQILFSINGEFANVVRLFDAYLEELYGENPSKIVLKTIAEAIILSLRKNLKAMLSPDNCEENCICTLAEEISSNPFYNWRASTLVKKLKCSITKLNQLFKNTTSQSFSKYLAKCRMQASLELIKSQKYSCEQIAKKAGFANRRSFSKAFRKFYGIPPNVVRKKI